MTTEPPAHTTANRYGTGRGGMAPAVYCPALVVIVVVAGFTLAFTEATESVIGAIQENAIAAFGWY